jgi:hypothetical protein
VAGSPPTAGGLYNGPSVPKRCPLMSLQVGHCVKCQLQNGEWMCGVLTGCPTIMVSHSLELLVKHNPRSVDP